MKCSRAKCTRLSNRQGLCHQHYERDAVRGYVPSGPVRDRIALLRTRGYSLTQLAQATGLSEPSLLCKYDTVQKATAMKVFAVPVPKKFRESTGWVPAVGTARRIRALMALGHTQTSLAIQVGVGHRQLSQVSRQEQVTSAMARRVAELYDQLMFTPGTSEFVRRFAKRNGWVPPLAWDDIDDPNEVPDVGERNRRAEIAEDVAEKRERVAQLTRMGLSAGEIAERLGVTKRHVVRYRADLQAAS